MNVVERFIMLVIFAVVTLSLVVVVLGVLELFAGIKFLKKFVHPFFKRIGVKV